MNLSAQPDLPRGLEPFLQSAGWTGAGIEPLPGDASFRRYFRIRRGDKTAMLMYAPPPNEDPAPFLRAARWLDDSGLRAPRILSEQADQGFVLLEDFGEVRMRDYLDEWPQDEREIYVGAVDALKQLHQLRPGPFTAYSLSEYQREAQLFVDWYCPAQNLYIDGKGYAAAWDEVLTPLLGRQRPGVTVLRDYHAENIMLLGALHKQGLLDFQDALIGHPAYDLASVLEDARRDVTPAVEAAMLARYQGATGHDIENAYWALAAQRNTRILGVFVRLWKRDGKPGYRQFQPRMWGLLERDLAHPGLAPVRAWFDENIPADKRAAAW